MTSCDVNCEELHRNVHCSTTYEHVHNIITIKYETTLFFKYKVTPEISISAFTRTEGVTTITRIIKYCTIIILILHLSVCHTGSERKSLDPSWTDTSSKGTI